MIPERVRRQPPAYSPLSIAALGAGVAAVVSGGEARDRLRLRVRERLGARDACLTDSGTTALSLALLAAKRLRSVPVALPAWSCYDVATAADGADVPVILYDLDPLTLGPNFNSLARALEHGAKSVVVAHHYGVPVDVERASRLAAEHRALLIEDAAQGVGIRFGERAAGSLGSLGVLSFGRGKGRTGGGGGALVANDAIGQACIEAVEHEIQPGGAGVRELLAATVQWMLGRPELYSVPASMPFLGLGKTVYHQPSPWLEMTDAGAAVLDRTWDLAEREAEVRRRNGSRLLAPLAVGGARVSPVRGTPGAVPGWLRLPVVLSSGRRDEVLTDSLIRLGVAPGYPQPLATLEPFRQRVSNVQDDMPGAALLSERLITLPTHSRLEARDLARLEAWIAGQRVQELAPGAAAEPVQELPAEPT